MAASDDLRATRKNTDEPADPMTATKAHARRGAGSRENDDHAVPKNFGRYQIIRTLGQGGMGVVYLAEDAQLGRKVALKVPRFGPEDGPKTLERFYREARTSAGLNHPNLCKVFDVGDVEGQPYLTMEFIDGRPLSDFIRAKKQLPERQAALVIRKLALALEEAHRAGVVHRDLKPANVMINRRGEPVVMDFGLARRFHADDPRLTQSGAVVGTPAYMSPEQISGDIDNVGPLSDQYSLGVIFYEMLTGELPFTGSVGVILGQIMHVVPPAPSKFRPGLDPVLEAICMKAIAKRPSERYGSMAGLAQAVTGFVRTSSDAARPTDALVEPGATVDAPRGEKSRGTSKLLHSQASSAGSADFDPYHRWLGIPKGERPPTHYQLLAISPDEADAGVIEEAIVRQSTYLRTYQKGEHGELCARLLEEVAAAGEILLDPERRRSYDAELARRISRIERGDSEQTPAATASPTNAEEDEDESADFFADLAGLDSMSPAAHETTRRASTSGPRRSSARQSRTRKRAMIAAGAAIAIFLAVVIFATSGRETIELKPQDGNVEVVSRPDSPPVLKTEIATESPAPASEAPSRAVPKSMPVAKTKVRAAENAPTKTKARVVAAAEPSDPAPTPEPAVNNFAREPAPADMPKGEVLSLAYNDNGNLLAVGAKAPNMAAVYVASSLRIAGGGGGGALGIVSIAWRPGNAGFAYVAEGQNVLTMQGQNIQFRPVTHRGTIQCIAYSPRGDVGATCTSDGEIVFWKPDGSVDKKMLANGDVRAIAWSRDGSHFAAALVVSPSAGRIQQWQTTDWSRTSVQFSSGVNCISFASDGASIATGHEDGSLRVWDTVPRKVHELSPRLARVRTIAWKPGSTWIAAGGDEGRVLLVRSDGASDVSLPVDADRINAVDWSPDGGELAVGGVKAGKGVLKILKFDSSATAEAVVEAPQTTIQNTAASAKKSETASEWKLVISDEKLTGWLIDAKPTDWKVADGVLTVKADGPGKLWLPGQYADFELEFEYRMEAGTNSGVFLRASPKGDERSDMLEVQLVDDSIVERPSDMGKAAAATAKARQTTGGLFALQERGRAGKIARKNLPKIGADWNTVRIVAEGQRIEVTLNGATYLDANLARLAFANPGHIGIRRTSGRIGLQTRPQGSIEFRNMRVRELPNSNQ